MEFRGCLKFLNCIAVDTHMIGIDKTECIWFYHRAAIKKTRNWLEGKLNKNNYLLSNFNTIFKFPALFSVQKRWEKREISICCRNYSQGSYSYFEGPILVKQKSVDEKLHTNLFTLTVRLISLFHIEFFLKYETLVFSIIVILIYSWVMW